MKPFSLFWSRHSQAARTTTQCCASNIRGFRSLSSNIGIRSSGYSGSSLYTSTQFKLTPITFLAKKFSTKNYVEFIPPIGKDARLVLPISVGRYNTTDPYLKEQFVQEINAIFKKTADMLQAGEIATADVICTAGLHSDWEKSKIEEIENFFFDQHSDLLSKQSAAYTWENWIRVANKQKYIRALQMVTEKSPVGSEWYSRMVKTHESVKMSNNLEQSLQYQRAEYAAIYLMQKYSNLVYLGQISSAWAFLYELFPDAKLPAFTRVMLRSQPIQQATPADASLTSRMVIELMERVLANQNLPKKEKHIIADSSFILFNTYLPGYTTKVSMQNSKDYNNHDLSKKPKL